MNGSDIECVIKHKILLVVIVQNLTWNEHINEMTEQLSCLIGLLYRIRNYLFFNMKCTFYSSFILSKIDYFANIWGGASKQAMDKILKMQKRAAVVVLNMDMDTPSSSKFNKLKLMTVYQRVRNKNLLLAYKV